MAERWRRRAGRARPGRPAACAAVWAEEVLLRLQFAIGGVGQHVDAQRHARRRSGPGPRRLYFSPRPGRDSSHRHDSDGRGSSRRVGRGIDHARAAAELDRPRAAATAADRPSPRHTRSGAPAPAAAACTPARETPLASTRGSRGRSPRRRNRPRRRGTRRDPGSRGASGRAPCARPDRRAAGSGCRKGTAPASAAGRRRWPAAGRSPARSGRVSSAIRRSGSDCPRRCGAGSNRRRRRACSLPNSTGQRPFERNSRAKLVPISGLVLGMARRPSRSPTGCPGCGPGSRRLRDTSRPGRAGRAAAAAG